MGKRAVVRFLALMLPLALLAGCWGPLSSTPRDLQLERDQTLTLEDKTQDLQSIDVGTGSTLTLKRSQIRLAGNFVVHGTLVLDRSSITFDDPDHNVAFNVQGGTVKASESSVIAPDWFTVDGGSVSWTGGSVVAGKFSLRQTQNANFTSAHVEALGFTTEGSELGNAGLNIMGSSIRMDAGEGTDAPEGTFFSDDSSTVRFVGFGVQGDALGGPGRYEIAWPHTLAVQDTGGNPVANVSLRITSNSGTTAIHGTTDGAGEFLTELVSDVYEDRVPSPRPEDPYLVAVEGNLGGAILRPSGQNSRTTITVLT